MSDYTTLIADARVWPRDGVNEGPLINALADAIEALVKERDQAIRDLDAGFAESDHLSAKYYQRMRAAEKHARMRASESADLERERDELAEQLKTADRQFTRLKESSGKADARAVELAAVVEKLGAVAKDCPSITTVDAILSTAPADVLREHDAALIENVLKDLWTEIHVQRFAADSHAADIPGVVKTKVNTFYAGVVRARSMVDSARARQVREGEA